MAQRPPRSSAGPARPLIGLVLLLIAAWYAVAVSSVREKSVTFDEPLHITAGYSWVQERDYRIDPEANWLVGHWVGLALAASGAALDTGDEYWKLSGGWQLAQRFLYEASDGKTLIWRARAVNAVFGCLLALLVFAWARELFGVRAACFSLALYLLSPTAIAHARLATQDTPAALFFCASMWGLWRALERPSVGRVLWSALCAAALLLSKFSGVLYGPMAVVLAIVFWAGDAERSRAARRILAVGAVHVAVVVAVIWSAYGFRYSAFSEPNVDFAIGWDFMVHSQSVPIVALMWLREHQLLPEAWLYGLGYALHYSSGKLAFMAGAHSVEGWYDFFPFAFWVKTPLPTIGIALLALLGAAHQLRRSEPARRIAVARDFLWRTAPLWVLISVYFGASVVFRMNVGQRHLLPLYPVLFILAGGLFATAAADRALRRLRGLAIALLVWIAVLFASAYPHYLSFFSIVAGGSERGHYSLIDSSLDWGQDLPAFKRWVDEHRRPDEVVYFSYFGSVSPRTEDIDAILINGFRDPPRRYIEFEPGLYGISATMLQTLYVPPKGPWTRSYERRFGPLHRLMQSPSPFETLQQMSPGADEQSFMVLRSHYDKLRFARLCHYLRGREPLDHAGGSILVYRLTAEDLAEAMAPIDVDSLPEIPEALVRWVPEFFR